MFEIVRYSECRKNEWNALIDNSKNGTFLFDRSYMDYHSNRFADFSLMIFRKEKLAAVLPAHVKDEIVFSHQGLSYGGLVYVNKLSAVDILGIFDAFIQYYKNNNIKAVIYKAIPYIYSAYPAQEDLYALFRSNAKLIGCNISSTIPLAKKLKFIESRKGGVRRAASNNLECEPSDDFDIFWDILNANLKTRYGVAPVHSIEEIKYLHGSFPQNIKLHVVKKRDEALAGTVLYINKNVVHVQYISASPEGKELGALDMLFDHLINNLYKDYEYFDFGQSTEQMGNYLNENLLFQKEGFGGRGVVYNIYEIKL
jgi:hypothetical protein